MMEHHSPPKVACRWLSLSTTPLQLHADSLLNTGFTKPMTPCYGMAGLYGKGSEGEDGLKEAFLDRFSRIVQAVRRQFKLLIHLMYGSEGPN